MRIQPINRCLILDATRYLARVLTALLVIGPLADQNAFAQTLSLQDVLQQSETYHPKLRGSDAERNAASAKRLSKQGAFDPVVFAGSDYLRYNSTSTRGKVQYTTMSDIGVELPFRSGVKVIAGTRLNLGNPKSPESSTGNTGEWNVSIKAPLRRGAGINDKQTAEEQAKLGEPISVLNRAAVRLDLLRQASLAYWDWVASAIKRTIASDLERIATLRADQIEIRYQKGDLPEFDASEARQEVVRRQSSRLKAERDERKAAFKLSLYLWDQNGARLPSFEEAPKVIAPAETPGSELQEMGQRQAINGRPELNIVRLQQQVVSLDVTLAENDRNPNVDLVFNPGLDTGKKSVGETMKAGVVFSLPLYRREATGRRDEASAKREKLRQEENYLRQQIETEVADAVNALRTAAERITMTEQEVALAERLEQAERKRFDLGEGTLFLVNQRERTTAEARQRLVEVQAEYQQALALYNAATVQL